MRSTASGSGSRLSSAPARTTKTPFSPRFHVDLRTRASRKSPPRWRRFTRLPGFGWRMRSGRIDCAMSAVLRDNSYGKSRVRLTKVVRDGSRHELFEINADIHLEGEF